jgi:hypothetical protein
MILISDMDIENVLTFILGFIVSKNLSPENS